MTSRKKSRSKRLFPRVLEAFIVLGGLLMAHQALWLLFDRYLINHTRDWLTSQSGAPDISIYLKPTDSTPNQNTETAPVYEVKDPHVRLTGLAPSRQFVLPTINNIDQPWVGTGSGRFTLLLGPLRRGSNEISASLIEGSEDLERNRYQAPRQVYYYRPTPLRPVIISVRSTGQGVEVMGLGEPQSQVFVQLSGARGAKSPPASTFTNDVGRFSYAFAEAIFPSELRVAVTREELEKLPADRLTPSQQKETAPADTVKQDEEEVPDTVKLSQNKDGAIVTEPALNFSRKIFLSLRDDNQYSFTLRMKLPHKTAIYEWVEKKQISPADLANRVFGLDCAGSRRCPFVANRQSLPVVTEEGIQLNVAGQTTDDGFDIFLVHGGFQVLGLAGDEILLELGNTQRVEISPEWLQQDATTRVWTVPAPNYNFLSVPRIQSFDAPAAPAAPRFENLGDYLRALERKFPDSLSRILQALLAAIPYLFLIWLLRDAKPGYQTTLRSVTASLLLFHLTILSLPVFSSSFSLISDTLAWIPGDDFHLYGYTIPRRVFEESLVQVGNIYPVLAIGISLLLLPIYRSYKHRPPAMTKNKRVLWGFVLRPFLLLAALTIPLFLFGFLVFAGLDPSGRHSFRPPSYPPTIELGRWLGMAGIVAISSALLLWLFLYWLVRISLGRRIKRWSVLKASWAMILLPLLPPLVETLAVAARYLIITKKEIYPFFIPRHLDQWLWLLIIPIIGAVVLFQVVYLAIRLSMHRPALRFYRSRRGKWLLLALFIFLSLPMRYLIGQRLWVGINDLTVLAYSIDALLSYVLLLGLLVYLRQLNPGDSFTLPRHAKLVGILLFAFYLTGRTANLLFVPIPFLFGWLLFGKWVLTDPVEIAGAKDTDPRTLVRRVLDYRQALNLTYDVRKTSEKKYSAGDITLEQLKKRVDESDTNLVQAKEVLPLKLSSSKEAIFGHGPEQGPWANAMLAVRYGLIISIPFQASTLSKIFAGRDFGPFPILTILRDILFTASFWVLAAFLFGYFFHLIRGRDGFRKALVYSVALIVPTLPLRLIQAQPLLGQGHVIQMVQIFAYMLVLALVAFDLRTLVNLGYTWRDLISVHGFSTIMGYVSSIALTTVASVTGKDIIGALWGYVKGVFKSV